LPSLHLHSHLSKEPTRKRKTAGFKVSGPLSYSGVNKIQVLFVGYVWFCKQQMAGADKSTRHTRGPEEAQRPQPRAPPQPAAFPEHRAPGRRPEAPVAAGGAALSAARKVASTTVPHLSRERRPPSGSARHRPRRCVGAWVPGCQREPRVRLPFTVNPPCSAIKLARAEYYSRLRSLLLPGRSRRRQRRGAGR
jgi:hypothetical protein